MTNIIDNRIFLLVGPSGIGKSPCFEEIDDKKLLKFKLDNVIKDFDNESSITDYFSRVGNEFFFKQSIIAIEKLKLENPDKKILIVVGEQTIDWESSTNILIDYQLISLSCDKKKLYDRAKNRDSENRTFDEYISSEFKPHKELLYKKAKFKIDTTYMGNISIAYEIISAIEKATYKFKYRPTVLNIVTTLWVIFELYLIDWPPKQEGQLAIFFLPIIVLFSVAVDLILQVIIRKYLWLTVAEIIFIILLYGLFSTLPFIIDILTLHIFSV